MICSQSGEGVQKASVKAVPLVEAACVSVCVNVCACVRVAVTSICLTAIYLV